MRESQSSLRDLMNRSTTAVARAWPPVEAYRGLIFRRLHHTLKARHQNCRPLSESTYFGTPFLMRMTLPRNAQASRLLGSLRNTVIPITRRE
jgi:hypothetical protein